VTQTDPLQTCTSQAWRLYSSRRRCLRGSRSGSDPTGPAAVLRRKVVRCSAGARRSRSAPLPSCTVGCLTWADYAVAGVAPIEYSWCKPPST